MLNKKACAAAVALTLLAASASAANVSASMTVAQSDGSTWVEDLSGLVVTDAQNNFAMVQGAGTSGFYQNGGFVSAAQTGSHPDYWQWNATSSSWNWHTAQTLNGTSPAAASSANPWQSVVNLQNFSGHGDPDMIYAVSAINNNALTQTYTFTFAEAIAPTVSGANTTYADISGVLTSRTGNVGGATIAPVNAGGIQSFQLSADNGSTFVNAGVDVGGSVNVASGTNSFAMASATNPTGPTGLTWNYMRMVSTFTLSGKSAASLAGFASITPVPEPQLGSMMLLGLGLIGTIVRRRSRRNLWQ
ncbi:PEP-CTERM sorting domain-containing protein [Rhodoferax lacus]|nr:PEP-CTERM sorting domain-containing protein [Rhodoferax lacus]